MNTSKPWEEIEKRSISGIKNVEILDIIKSNYPNINKFEVNRESIKIKDWVIFFSLRWAEDYLYPCLLYRSNELEALAQLFKNKNWKLLDWVSISIE